MICVSPIIVVEETKKPNAEDLDVQHFVGLDERQGRLVLFQGAADAEGGTLTVPKSVLARYDLVSTHCV
jgi:hypothetical protein